MERKKENKNCPKMLLRDEDFFNEERKCRNETGNVTANPATSKKILLIVPYVASVRITHGKGIKS